MGSLISGIIIGVVGTLAVQRVMAWRKSERDWTDRVAFMEAHDDGGR